jgi:hypothetical protein
MLPHANDHTLSDKRVDRLAFFHGGVSIRESNSGRQDKVGGARASTATRNGS